MLVAIADVSLNLLAAPFSVCRSVVYLFAGMCASRSFCSGFRELIEEFLTGGTTGAIFINGSYAQFYIQNVSHQFLLP